MNDNYLLLAVISTIVFLILAVFIVFITLLYQQRQIQVIKEKADLKAAYDQEILRSQLEVQNQTLQQIGNELHDNIGQLLSVTRLYLNVLEERGGYSYPHQEPGQRFCKRIRIAQQPYTRIGSTRKIPSF
jgi:two-component system NarL family sensor kinase